MLAANRLLVQAYLLRGATLWLLTRILASVMIALADANPLTLSARSSLLIIVVATTLGFAQTWRLHETVLLGNLGVSRAMLAIWFAVPAVVGELIVSLAGATLA
jgi:hypothetical protein